MTHRMVFTEHLPTLALVGLGASEAVVGLQQTFLAVGQLLQLPTLRSVSRVAKRTILVSGQTIAVLGGLPLLFFGTLASLGPDLRVAIALASFMATAVGIVVADTVWFPLLRGYVEPNRIGRFFGTLRTGWHLTLILYYLGAQRWLSAHAGGFAPLFAVGWICGLVRIALVSRLPERSERTGSRLRVRDALALLRSVADLRPYLFGTMLAGAVKRTVVPFSIVMMRREVGFSDADVVVTTIAFFAGGLASLYLWGRAVDRVGPAPIFRWTSLATAALIVALLAVRESGGVAFALMIGFFFLFSALHAGFGVADTHVLFRLAPPEAPAPLIVVSNVVYNVGCAIPPLLVGVSIEWLLARGAPPLDVYHGFFVLAAIVQAAAFLPLRRFTR